ncbi:hypothetical protein BGZ94_005810 [Podila epigama]|nr:hypothetical protein BGZ94_005810 [Podila epigama]
MVPENSTGVPQADHVTVLFASQTGNAESISRNIYEQAQERGFKSFHYVLNDHAKIDWATEECLVFVVSTTGDGDPPDNSTKFWRHLRKLKGTGLTKAKYAILGLGDTNYDNFCQTAKRLDTKLQELGATPFYPRGLADDATGLEDIVDPWIKNLWPALAHQVISTPTIHDLPQPHLTEDETKILKDIVAHEHEPEQKQEPKLEQKSTPTTSVTSPTTTTTAPQQSSAKASAVANESENVNPQVDAPTVAVASSLAKDMEALSVASTSTAAVAASPSSSSGSTHVTPAVGNIIEVDFSSMADHANLTALPRVPNANLKLTQLESTNEVSNKSSKLPSFIQTPAPLLLAKINNVQCLTPEDALKRTLAVEFGFDDDVEYAPGDAFGIIAPNDESLVRGVLATLGVKDEDLNKPVRLSGEGIPSHLAPIQSATLLDIFRYAVDLTTAVKKSTLRLYGEHAADLAEKQKLMFMASKQGAEVFNLFRAQGATLLDILTTFPSVKIPIVRVIETLPPLLPRYYSITNSPLAKNGHRRWSCAFNVVEYEQPVGVKRRGVCTPWLDDLSGRVAFGQKAGNNQWKDVRVPMFVKPNETKFNLPADTTKPVIMIGPGTGVAPFMGFLEHRAEQRRIKKRLMNVGSGTRGQYLDDIFGEVWLFFGCRHRERDWLFRREMETYKEEGVLTQLKLAVSREENIEDKHGKYVQDMIRRDAKNLWELLSKKGALIYVCGDAKGMAKSVHDELVALLVEHGGYEKMAAIMELNKWAQEKRYLRDLWA